MMVWTGYPMKRGEIFWVVYDPTIGSEIQKTRPSVIVSCDAANTHAPVIQVVPLTSNTERLYPGEAVVSVQGKKAKAMANQIRTVSKQRIQGRLGELSAQDMQTVDLSLKIQLGLI
jgi:mRNA interferase MazF